MNRVILIGNGFDLAHGLKTGYNDFIDDYWNMVGVALNKHNSCYNDEIDFYSRSNIRSLDTLYEIIDKHSVYSTTISDDFPKKEGFIFRNKFLKIITETKTLQNWVDIENEYYNLLLQVVRKDKFRKYNDVNKLNSDFESVKNLLDKYLGKEVKKDIPQNEKISSKIYSDFNPRDLSEKMIQNYVDLLYMEASKGSISISSRKKIIKKDLFSNGNTYSLIPKNILFLSFNYTDIESKYFLDENKDKYNVETVHIHGSLYEEDNNPIIFGFGDELDDNYKKIEKLNQNEFLENIKSIKYLETDNYKKTLEFLNSDDYQVFIFGHSCGVSDRTLLNTIFEHKNCGSIKPFYYEWKEYDGEKEVFKNNYSDIVRNISRNFNSKVEMREKVVNKEYCESLT